MKVTQLCLKLGQMKRDNFPLFSFLPNVSPKAEQGRAGLQQATESDWGRKRVLAGANLVAVPGNPARPCHLKSLWSQVLWQRAPLAPQQVFLMYDLIRGGSSVL